MMAVTQIRYPATAGRRYYERKRREGKTPPRKRCGVSSGGCLTWCTTSCWPTSAAQSERADHLQPRRRRGLHPPHQQPVRTGPHHSPSAHTGGFVALDWKDGRLVGIEILDASTRLHHDLLDQAEING
jgi:hypothetical protein